MKSGRTSREAFLDEIERAIECGAEPEVVGVEHQRADAALRGSYRALYENIPLMCFTLDASGRILAVNSFGAGELGYRPEELIGQPVLMVFHPDDQPSVDEQIRLSLENPGRVAKWQFRKLRQDGSMLWVQEAARVVEEDGRKIVLVVCEDVTERVEATERLVQYQQQLRALTSELALVEERERRRIADGLHDQIGQVLAIAKLRLASLQDAGASEAADRTIEEVCDLLDQALKETRSLTFELSCPVLYRLGLEEGLRDLCERLGQQTGVLFHFDSDSRPKPLGEDAQITLYRIVQELLFNVVKHARADHAWLGVARVGGEIRITVDDDGVGFDASQLGPGPTPAGRLGLFGVRERLDHLGGHLAIDPDPGAGTRIVVAAPLVVESQGKS